MSETTLTKRVRFHRDAIKTKRDALLGIGETLSSTIGEIEADRFYDRNEKQSRIARARAEASGRVRGAAADAREALELARGFVASELNRAQASPQAEERIRRLIDLRKAPNEIHARAVQLRDREMLAALRREISWGLVEAGEELVRDLDRSIAALTPDGGDQLAELLDAIDTSAVREAEKLVNSIVAGDNHGRARLAFAYATGATGNGNGDSGGGDGE